MMFPKVLRLKVTPSSNTSKLFSNKMISAEFFSDIHRGIYRNPDIGLPQSRRVTDASPKNPTVWPACCNARTIIDFCKGVNLAKVVVFAAAISSS